MLSKRSLRRASKPGAMPPIKSWNFHQNGDYSIVTFAGRPDSVDVLLDKDAKPITAEHFDVPTYVGGRVARRPTAIAARSRLIFTSRHALHQRRAVGHLHVGAAHDSSSP